MNIFSNIAVDTKIDTLVKISKDENQNKIEYGDVLFTGSSETPDECGMSSVLTKQFDEPLYLNSFCFGFRLYDKSLFLPEFLKYLFRDEQTRKQIANTASGVTRFNVSKKRFAKIKIPIPPLAIQQEIVKILDTFTTLEAELAAELEARKKQYEYYRNELLMFGDDVEWKTLGEVGTLIRGSGLQKKDFVEEGVGCIHYGQIYTYYGLFTTITKSFVSPELARTLKKVNTNDIIITNTSENVEDVCTPVVWLGKDEIVTGGHATIIKHEQNAKYLAYYFMTAEFADQKRKLATGTKVIDVSATNLAKVRIPLPPLAIQQEIVKILDTFTTLAAELAAELAARKKQYEYYRNKLLTFQEKQ